MKLYTISGLGADQRVFQYLKLKIDTIPLEWISPKKNETIETYAKRLALKINPQEPFAIIGVSFGGLIATEISKQLRPDLTILISSAETRSELRPIYRLIGKMGIIKLIPRKLFLPPTIPAAWAFGTNRKKLLGNILKDTDPTFTKWAVNELVNWTNTTKIKNPCLRIVGTNDKLIPPKNLENKILISGGEHFMIVDKADEISAIINGKLNR